MNTRTLLTMAVTGLLLVACGGSDGPGVDERLVPASATASPGAYTDYVGTRPADDTLEPLLLEGVVPPVTDSEEPLPLR
jgi:hypothetical protein